MRRAKRISLLNFLIVAAASLLLYGAAPGWSAEIGEPIPDFSMKSLDGGSFSRAALDGKPVLLIFWNTWCPDCMKELPEVSRLAGKFGPEGLMVLAVNTAMNDSESKARAYWEKQGYKFPTGFDYDYELGQAFGVRGVPTIFLIDSQGIVRFKQSRLPADIEDRLKKL